MGFHISHLKKYWRWVKRTQADYRDCCTVSRELAGINRRLAVAALRGQEEKVERISDEKQRTNVLGMMFDYLREKNNEVSDDDFWAEVDRRSEGMKINSIWDK